jgi:7-cyano-7-deazaguanine synthase
MLKRQASSVVLLSGGLDSATVLALAKEQGFALYALSLDYGQRHAAELKAASRVAASLGVLRHEIIRVDLARFGQSALTDKSIDVPAYAGLTGAIPLTYVPARNTVMLAIALSWMEALGGRDIFFGANAVDYSGYPDCRPEYVRAFEAMANLATKSGVEGQKITVHVPMMTWTKAEIIRKGIALSIDYSLTVSCYQADAQGRACARCDACQIRRSGFAQAMVADPTVYC